MIARRAQAGETLTTLDGVSRTLDPSMTVIADDGGPIGVSGSPHRRSSERRGDGRSGHRLLVADCAIGATLLVAEQRHAPILE